MSASFDVKGRRMVVQTADGTLTGRLASYYECPKCHSSLRFITFFETAEQSHAVLEAMKRTNADMHVVMFSRLLVGSAGVLNGYGEMAGHGYKSNAYSYGYGAYGSPGCAYRPFLGSDHEFASVIWNNLLRRISGKPNRPFPLTRFDISKIPGLLFTEDQLDSGMPRLMLHSPDLLSAPQDHLAKRWDPARERYEDYERRLTKLPDEFLKTIAA